MDNMDTTDGALLPVHVRIFQGLVPQVASQATSLENILRTLCQKIETLESCLASINSGVVEMDMRLKIIAHNIEGGTNDEAFNAASTFMPSLASPLPATKPSKSAVVSHVMSALAMGHVAKPLEKPKKRRKKPPPALSSPAGLVTSIPTAELSAGPTETPPTLNRGHSSARLLRDSPRSRYIPDQRDVPHTARSKANVHAVPMEHIALSVQEATTPRAAISKDILNDSQQTIVTAPTKGLSTVEDIGIEQVHAEPWENIAPTDMRLLVDVEDKKDDLINSTDPNRHVTASKGPTISVGYEEASKMEADSIDRSVPTGVSNTTQVDKIHTPTADGSNVPSIQLERRRPSHPEPPPSPPPDDAAAVHTIPRLPLSRLVVENSAGKSTQTTPSVAKPHATSMQAAAAPTTTVAAERQTLLANAQPQSTGSTATTATTTTITTTTTQPQSYSHTAGMPLPLATTETTLVPKETAVGPHSTRLPTSSPQSPREQHRHTITAAIDPSPVNLLSQEKWPPQEDAESSDESSDSVDEEVQPSEEELQRLKEAGQHGWKVVRSKLATIKRPKNILFTKKKQLFTIANRLELLERKSKELFAGEKQLTLLLEKQDNDLSTNILAAVELKLKALHRDILKITDDKAEMHLVVQFSHRIRDLEENVRHVNADMADKLAGKASQIDMDRKLDKAQASAQVRHDSLQEQLREQAMQSSDHGTRLRLVEEHLVQSNQRTADQFHDLVAQLQANQAAVDDMRRLLRKKADVKVLKGLEESMMLKPKDPMDQQQQQPCAARCMSCMKDILVDLPGGDPENDVADAHDLVHNGLTRKVNIGQFASKVYRSSVPLNAELVGVREEAPHPISPLE
ncbi:hypothetical protein, variant [Aphanomyces astaci]|nr:hypothetical protein, variant [Aphanomyces astaci]ETV73594.1 hypothetical protein, variant [Aphanomyces astaci]|eukprot:XP_009837020.1 hypothetical protein, variant [Aphanomyces astaci]